MTNSPSRPVNPATIDTLLGHPSQERAYYDAALDRIDAEIARVELLAKITARLADLDMALIRSGAPLLSLDRPVDGAKGGAK